MIEMSSLLVAAIAQELVVGYKFLKGQKDDCNQSFPQREPALGNALGTAPKDGGTHLPFAHRCHVYRRETAIR
jgi:hypothetical protein